MIRYPLLLLLFFVAFISCKESSVEENIVDDIRQEVRGLTSDDAKRNYLEKILEDDQRVRGSEGQQLALAYGADSEQHMNWVDTQIAMDDDNLHKIETYFDIHGYPSAALGADASTAPWIVIHHAQDYEARERNFATVYGAYQNGDIDDGAVSFYLGRMYRMKFGEGHTMENPYMPEDEIDFLIEALELRNHIDDGDSHVEEEQNLE